MVQNIKFWVSRIVIESKNIYIYIYRIYDKNKINFIFILSTETNEKNRNLMLEEKVFLKKKNCYYIY